MADDKQTIVLALLQ